MQAGESTPNSAEGYVLLVGSTMIVLASDHPELAGQPVPNHLRAAVASILSGGGGVAQGWDLIPMFTSEGNGVSCVRRPQDGDTGHDSFLKVIENNPFGIYLIDSDFNLAKVSEGAKKVFANVYPLLGRDFADILRFVWTEPFASEAISQFRHTLETGEPFHSRDTREKRGDTQEVEAYDWKIERVAMPHGKYGVVCYFYDLTEQIKLRKDIEFLAEFVDMLRHSSVEAQICESATQSVTDYYGGNLCCITEIENDTERITAVNGGPPDAVPSPYILNDTLRSGVTWVCADTTLVPETAEACDEYGIRSMVAVPKMRDDKCVSTFVVCTSAPRKWERREIALIESLADRLWTTINALRLHEKMRVAQRLESVGILAGGIAHDFNNLLTGILGASEMAREEVGPDSPVTGYLNTVLDAGQRAADLTAQLLAYAGKGITVVEPLDLVQFINGMAQLLKIAMPRNVEFVLDLDVSLPKISADRGQIHQVLMNLALNAAESFSEGTPGTVKISAHIVRVSSASPMATSVLVRAEPGEYVELQITDDGAGMDAETQTRIFDPFFTTKFMGRGLGLAAVLGIVAAHKGGIEIDSVEGKGTTFRVLFPALPASHAVSPPDAESINANPGARVLVVDDEEVVREFAMEALLGAGYEVLLATNGQEGVDVFLAQADDIHLVLLDLTMPVLDGEGAFEALRSVRPDIPIVVMSGYSDSEASGRFAGKGLSGFIRKPFTVASLRMAVQKGISGDGN